MSEPVVEFFEGVALTGFGSLLFIAGMLVMAPVPGAPKDWRYSLGSVLGIAGVGLAVYAAMTLLLVR